ncbi:MAG: glycosyltransferase [Saprospiraceae bacterium]|nr:glycosyltransferase [Saprospiraceae bacterium]
MVQTKRAGILSPANLRAKVALAPSVSETLTPQREKPLPWLYLSVFALWAAAMWWFQPRLWSLLDMSYSTASWLALLLFVLFIDFAWLYGLYNVTVVLFAWGYALKKKRSGRIGNFQLPENHPLPPVAILYTTCNDFVEESVLSCVRQDYPNYTVYILDDSSSPEFQLRIDRFANRFRYKVKVIRRPDRRAFKAGNMNYGLENFVSEPYFAIADADEILPVDFLSKLVPVMEADPQCGFVQANHRANPDSESTLAKDLGVGIDLHWKWYQPLRNDFGFVMFLGHGALLRRKCWEEIGGFPEIVSEDLGYAINIREKGYRGRFVEDVVCFEDFPDTVRAFRIRHMKWTRGTCEFLKLKMMWLLRARNISWAEKLDILFPTLNLPLTILYFFFMIDANLMLPWFFGERQDLTWVTGGVEFSMPIYTLGHGFDNIYSGDFFMITLLTFFAPVLCFLIGLARQPLKLFKFISHSTALYAALGPLSALGVITYFISGKAVFLVTGDNAQQSNGLSESKGFWSTMRSDWKRFLQRSHPDSKIVQTFEVGVALLFGTVCIFMFQISFLGLCFAFALLPLMHHLGWKNRFVRAAVYAPFFFILAGLLLAGLSLFGMQTVFFGYGFHF